MNLALSEVLIILGTGGLLLLPLALIWWVVRFISKK